MGDYGLILLLLSWKLFTYEQYTRNYYFTSYLQFTEETIFSRKIQKNKMNRSWHASISDVFWRKLPANNGQYETFSSYIFWL